MVGFDPPYQNHQPVCRRYRRGKVVVCPSEATTMATAAEAASATVEPAYTTVEAPPASASSQAMESTGQYWAGVVSAVADCLGPR